MMDEQYTESMEELTDGVEYAVIDGFSPGERLRIGSLTAGDLIEWTDESDPVKKKLVGLQLICKSLVNRLNERYANDEKNIEVFKRKGHKACERIILEILQLNGLNVTVPAAEVKVESPVVTAKND